jgi:hypothetical protein
MAKKVAIYPIELQLVGRSTIAAHIIKLSYNSFLVSSNGNPLKVNDPYKANFILPVKNIMISTDAVVYKTYDEFKGQHGTVNPGKHVAELVLRNPTKDVKNAISTFLAFVKAQQI